MPKHYWKVLKLAYRNAKYIPKSEILNRLGSEYNEIPYPLNQFFEQESKGISHGVPVLTDNYRINEVGKAVVESERKSNIITVVPIAISALALGVSIIALFR